MHLTSFAFTILLNEMSHSGDLSQHHTYEWTYHPDRRRTRKGNTGHPDLTDICGNFYLTAVKFTLLSLRTFSGICHMLKSQHKPQE